MENMCLQMVSVGKYVKLLPKAYEMREYKLGLTR